MSYKLATDIIPMDDRKKIHSRLLKLGGLAERHSICKRKGVACLLFNRVYEDGILRLNLAAEFINQPVMSDPDNCTGLKGRCGCIHAETFAAAWIHANPATPGPFIVAVNYSPCVPCAHQLIVTGRVSHVVWRKFAPHHPDAPAILVKSGIHHEQWPE